MGAVARVVDRLRRHPGLTCRVRGTTVTVDPPGPGGFAVSLTEAGGTWVVGFDGWHEHFRSEAEALDCFAFGLSDRCRLRVEYRGPYPCRWTVEERTAAGWQADSTTGRVLVPFWLPRRVEYRQNAVLRDESPPSGSDS